MAGAVRWRRLHATAPLELLYARLVMTRTSVVPGKLKAWRRRRVAGQSYEYLVESMRRFAEGERKNNATMVKMMAAILPADRAAMARYLSGL